MKILITGNMGYVGAGVISQLRSAFPTCQLIGFDMVYFGVCLTDATVLPESKLDLQLFGDLRTMPAEFLIGVDMVIHLAALPNDPMDARYEYITLDVNYKASIRIACAMALGRISILSDDSPWRPLIHVMDMARAIEWAIHRTKSNGRLFLAVNIGSDQWNYQIRALDDAVAGTIPGTTITLNKDAASDERSYRGSFRLFKLFAPDYQPQYTLKKAIEEMRDGLLAIGFKDEDFRNSCLQMTLTRIVIIFYLTARNDMILTETE